MPSSDNRLMESIIEFIKNRTTSAAYGTYFFFWSAFHWQGLYTSAFTSEELIYEKLGLLKNEYVNQYFFGWHGWSSFWGYFSPLMLTVVFVWLVPRFVLVHAYRVEQEHKTARKNIKATEEQKRQAYQAFLDKKVSAQEEKRVVARTKLSTAQKAAKKVDPTILWDSEYNEFASEPNFNEFVFILQSVYEHDGRTRAQADGYGDYRFRLGGSALKLADTYGLITITSEKGDTRIKLTEKGKYFAKKFPDYKS